MAKHYIRLNEQNRIIKAISTDFEEPLETDICVNEDGGRHFSLDLFDGDTGAYQLTWSGTEIVPADLTVEKAAKAKQDAKAALYNAMVADVNSKMVDVFGTTNADSANANYQSWQLMVSSAEMFVSAGLTSDISTDAFDVGDALDTTDKIIMYGQGRVSNVHTYGLWRLKRIQQFRTDLAALN